MVIFLRMRLEVNSFNRLIFLFAVMILALAVSALGISRRVSEAVKQHGLHKVWNCNTYSIALLLCFGLAFCTDKVAAAWRDNVFAFDIDLCIQMSFRYTFLLKQSHCYMDL